jgi:hypothetical protein
VPAYSMGHVDLAIFAAMMPTILIAAPIGVRAGHWLSEAWLRRIHTILLMICPGLRPPRDSRMSAHGTTTRPMHRNKGTGAVGLLAPLVGPA